MDEERFLKCIVDNNRRLILDRIGNSEMCVNDIIERTGLEQTLVSFHLKALKNCGFVTSKREGKNILYKASDAEIMDALKMIRMISSKIKSGDGNCD